ncbi:MAG: hypothetical protein WCD75_07050 [Rhodoplanes sp.]
MRERMVRKHGRFDARLGRLDQPDGVAGQIRPSCHPGLVFSTERATSTARSVRSMLFWMIAEGCSNAGSILVYFVFFHPNIELLDFGNPKVLKMFRRLFESYFGGLFPRGRAAADETDDPINAHLTVSFVASENGLRRGVTSHSLPEAAIEIDSNQKIKPTYRDRRSSG